MKKNTLLTVVLIIVLSMSVSVHESIAQTEPVNKLIVSFGGGTVPEIIEDTNELAEAIFDGTRTSETSFSGTFSIQYDHVITTRYSVGVSFIFQDVSKDVTITSPTNATFEDAYEAKYFTVLMNGTYQYMSLKSQNLELYARLGIGVSFTKEEYLRENFSNESVLFAYQISPIGMRVGNKLFFQAEAGFGYLGIMSVGVGYRF